MKEPILAVQRMQDYIEAHLDEKIGLSELSGVSLFSPWKPWLHRAAGNQKEIMVEVSIFQRYFES